MHHITLEVRSGSYSWWYGPILSLGNTDSHLASGSSGCQRSSTSSHTVTCLTTLKPRDSNRRMEGVLALPILAIRLCGDIDNVVMAYERLESGIIPRIMIQSGSQEIQGFTSESFPSIFLACSSAMITPSAEKYVPAIMISHSASPLTPSGRNIFTSPTILHPLISSGERRGWVLVGR